MRSLVFLAMQAFMAMVVCMFAGMLLLIVPIAFLKMDPFSWLAAPYSPLFWGLALVAGFALGRRIDSNSARWVWVVGIAWFLFQVLQRLSNYAAPWFVGDSRGDYFWYVYAAVTAELESAWAQMFATTPMLNSIAYSIGAIIATRASQSRTASTTNETAGPTSAVADPL